MTRFEEIGVELQERSRNKKEAKVLYKHSCDLCCNSGLNIRCNRCAIDYAHTRMLGIFSVMKKSTRHKDVCA